MDYAFLRRVIAAAETDHSGDEVYAYLARNYPAKLLGWVRKAHWTRQRVPLSHIDMARRVGGARDPKKVEGIARAVQDGKPMDPVVLVDHGDKYTVADGYHRTLGFQHAGKKSIEAWIGHGVPDDAWDPEELHRSKLNASLQAVAQDGPMDISPIDNGVPLPQGDWPVERTPETHIVVNPGQKRIKVRVAHTPALRAVGLSNTPEPAPGSTYDPMLFRWPADARAQLTNHATEVPVSAHWFDSSGAWVDHAHMLPNQTDPVGGRVTHRYVLEMHPDDADALGIGPGSSISLDDEKETTNNDPVGFTGRPTDADPASSIPHFQGRPW